MDPVSSTPPFQFVGGSLALDFINTVGNRLSEPRDYFERPADVRTWAAAAGLLDGVHRPTDGGTGADLRRVVEARERLYELLVAGTAGRPGPRSRTMLAWLTRAAHRAGAHRQLAASPEGPAWRWIPGILVPDLVISAAVLDTVRLLTDRTRPRLSPCADSCCGWLFLDLSKGQRRKWCSMADCGNRAKARRHYRKQSRNEERRTKNGE